MNSIGFRIGCALVTLCACTDISQTTSMGDAGGYLGAAAEAPRAALARPADVALDCPPDHFGQTRVAVGELTLNVACWGSGKPALLLHGYPEFFLTWNKLAPTLVAAGYRVIAPDQRGYNRSDRPEPVAAYAIDHLVSDILGVLDASAETRVLLIGHDWGGTVAYVFAHRHPERVRGLITMSAPHPAIWGNPDVDPVLAWAGDFYIPVLASPLGGWVMPFISLMLSPHLEADDAEAYQAAWDVPGAVDAMNKWYQANNYPDYKLPRDARVEVPTLAFSGMDDVFVTPSHLDALPRFVPKLETVRVKGVDHWMTHQITPALGKRMLEFARQLPE